MPVSFCVLQRFLRTNGNVFENKREREAEPSGRANRLVARQAKTSLFLAKVVLLWCCAPVN